MGRAIAITIMSQFLSGFRSIRPRTVFSSLKGTSFTRSGPSIFTRSVTMEGTNRVKVALEAGQTSMGLWQMIPGANISRLLANSGPDWVCVDCEHGNIDDSAMHDAVPAIAAHGVSPLVRIPDMQGWMVKRALDAGAHGVIVPLIRTVEDAKQLVRSAKFPPLGDRGFGSPLSMDRFRPVPSFTEYLQQANDNLLTIVQIETKEALASVEEIAEVPGIDVLFIGPFDLGNNIGEPIINGNVTQGLKEAIGKVLQASHKAGKKCGIFSASGEQANVFAGQGFDMISVATDYTALAFSMQATMSAAKGTANPTKGGSY